MSQVVNARRGMYTAGGRSLTRTSTTRFGTAPGRQRLMPEQIYEQAGSRDQAVDLLRRNGYLRNTPRPAARVTPAWPSPTARSTPRRRPPAKARPAAPKPRLPKPGKPRWIDPDKAEDMQKSMLADDPWTNRQIQALSDYSSEDYSLVNDVMRGLDDLARMTQVAEDNTRRMIQDVASAMRPLPRAVTVTRRVNGDAFGLGSAPEMDDLRSLVGQTRQDPAFMSTTISPRPNTRFGPIQLQIDVPKGTPAAYLEGVTRASGELELLLAPGQRYQILDVIDGPDGPRVMVRLLP